MQQLYKLTNEKRLLVDYLIELSKSDINSGVMYISQYGTKQNLRLLRSVSSKGIYGDHAAQRLNKMRELYKNDLKKLYYEHRR